MHPISSSKANEITSILISTLLTINSNGICLHSLLESIQVRTKGKRFPVLLFTLLSMTIFDCFSTVIDKIAKPLSHPSFIPHWELDFFSVCLPRIVGFLFADFILSPFLFSSKSELHFYQIVVLPLGNRFLFTQDNSSLLGSNTLSWNVTCVSLTSTYIHFTRFLNVARGVRGLHCIHL